MRVRELLRDREVRLLLPGARQCGVMPQFHPSDVVMFTPSAFEANVTGVRHFRQEEGRSVPVAGELAAAGGAPGLAEASGPAGAAPRPRAAPRARPKRVQGGWASRDKA
jgi:hypothetical protein